MLIFFMLTSSFITPSGIAVNLPAGTSGAVEMQRVSVTITKDLDYYIEDQKVTRASFEGELKSRLGGTMGSVVLYVDKSVPSEHLVYLADIAAKLEAKVVIATKPDSL
jgi:biopolymer transport protein ExbD